MKVTKVTITLPPKQSSRVLAFADVFLDYSLAINGVKVVRYADGSLHAVFPRGVNPYGKKNRHAVAPLTKELRAEIEGAIVEALERHKEKGGNVSAFHGPNNKERSR